MGQCDDEGNYFSYALSAKIFLKYITLTSKEINPTRLTSD